MDFLKKNLPYIALAWISFAWGTTWLASKEGVKYVNPIQLVAMRQIIAATAYFVFFIAIKKFAWPNKKQWKTIIILCFFNFICSNTLSTWGVKYISSGLGAIIGTIFPIFLVIIQIIRKEYVPKKVIAYLFLCFIGICIVFYDYLPDFTKADFTFGIILSLIAAFTWAIFTYLTKQFATTFNPYLNLGYQMLLSSLFLFTYLFFSGTATPLSSWPSNAWNSLLYLVIIGSIITFVAFAYMVQKLPPTVSSLYAYLNPIVALILGNILFQEKLNWHLAIGIVVILFGIYKVNSIMRK